MSGPPLVLGPVHGLRTWLVDGGPGAERLVGAHSRAAWPAGGAPMRARCPDGGHEPPGPGCTCGLYGWHPTRAAARRVCAVRREVPGIVEATGGLEVHGEGFRAAAGRPRALVLLPGRNEKQLERLAAAYDAELLRLDGPNALLEHCRTHGLGLAEQVVVDLLGRERLGHERRARRRRAVRTALSAAAVAAGLAALGVALDREPEPGKVLHGRTGEIRVP